MRYRHSLFSIISFLLIVSVLLLFLALPSFASDTLVSYTLSAQEMDAVIAASTVVFSNANGVTISCHPSYDAPNGDTFPSDLRCYSFDSSISNVSFVNAFYLYAGFARSCHGFSFKYGLLARDNRFTTSMYSGELIDSRANHYSLSSNFAITVNYTNSSGKLYSGSLYNYSNNSFSASDVSLQSFALTCDITLPPDSASISYNYIRLGLTPITILFYGDEPLDTDPPVSDPVEPPVSDPVEPPVSDPVDSPVSEPVDPPVSEPVDPPVTDPSGGGSCNCQSKLEEIRLLLAALVQAYQSNNLEAYLSDPDSYTEDLVEALESSLDSQNAAYESMQEALDRYMVDSVNMNGLEVLANQGGVTALTSQVQHIYTSMPWIVTLMVFSVTLATVSYILYGKKG